jgi:hypothetical protein
MYLLAYSIIYAILKYQYRRKNFNENNLRNPNPLFKSIKVCLFNVVIDIF